MIYNKNYKADFDKRKYPRSNSTPASVAHGLEASFPDTNQLTEQEQEDWKELAKEAKDGDKKSKQIMKNRKTVSEITKLMYVNGTHAGRERLPEPNELRVGNKRKYDVYVKGDPRPHVFGIVYNLKTKESVRVGPLNPDWVETFFKGVFVELVKIQPEHWWLVVMGEAREDSAPT